MKIQRYKILFFLLSIMLILSACENGVGAILSSGNKPIKKEVSQNIYLPMEKVRTLNPVMSKDEDTYYINKLIYDGLFEIDDNMQVVPSLAESYNYNDEEHSMTIILKNNLLWQDGMPVTGNDVVFSINTYMDNLDSHLFTSKFINIKSVKTNPNNVNSVIIKFNEGERVGVESLTFPILPKHRFKEFQFNKSEFENFIPIGTGQYMVESYDALKQLKLIANQSYFKTPASNQLTFEIIPNRNNALNMLEVNGISLAISKDINRDVIYRNPSIETNSFISNEAVWLGFNFNKEILKNKKIRQAIVYAIDTNEILETCYFNSGVLTDTIYYPNFLGISQKKDPYVMDIKKSGKFLKEAGFIDKNKDGVLEYPANPAPENSADITVNFNLILLVNVEDQSRVEAGKEIEKALKKVGINCELNIETWENYEKRVNDGDYDIYLGGSQFSEEYNLTNYLRSETNNFVNYGNAQLDIYLDALEYSNTNEDRAKNFKEIYEILREEIPYYCLLYKTYVAVSSPSLKGTVDVRFNNIYKGCEHWENVNLVEE